MEEEEEGGQKFDMEITQRGRGVKLRMAAVSFPSPRLARISSPVLFLLLQTSMESIAAVKSSLGCVISATASRQYMANRVKKKKRVRLSVGVSCHS